MIYAYDTEFVEDCRHIDLVSIGIAAEDGRALYLISSEFDEAKLLADSWLAAHIWPALPTTPGKNCRCRLGRHGHLDRDHPAVRSLRHLGIVVGGVK